MRYSTPKEICVRYCRSILVLKAFLLLAVLRKKGLAQTPARNLFVIGKYLQESRRAARGEKLVKREPFCQKRS